MKTRPRHALAALGAVGTAGALALSLGLTPAQSAAPQALKAGTSGASTYKELTSAKPKAGGKKNYVKLDLLALNDFHGQLEPVATGSTSQINNTPAGGAAFLASLLNKERKKSRAAGATPLTVAAGDLIGASPLLSAAFHDEPTITALSKMKLDVASVGNHEFDEGVSELLRMQKGGCLPDGPNGANGANSCPGDQNFEGAEFKYLGANVFWKNTAGKKRPTIFKPYQIKRVDDQLVGFIGMTLEGTPEIVSQAGIADVTFADEVATANALVPKLRKKGVKSIVVLLHEGVAPRDTTAYNSCTGVTGPALQIAQQLAPQIDAVISGHTHQAYNCVVKDPKGRPRLLTSASSLGRMVTKVHLLIDPRTRDVVRPAAYAENQIVANSEGQGQSFKILKLISTFKTLVQPIADQVVGSIAAGSAAVNRDKDANGEDTTLGNLVADGLKADPSVVQAGRKPVIGITNPGGIRADLANNANGVVTYGQAFAVQPFSNFALSMDLTGAQIRAILNEGFNGTNEGTGARKVLQVSGMSYTWDVSDATPGTGPAVTTITVDDDGNAATPEVPIVDTQVYRVATLNFLADGGDGFTTFKQGTNRLVGGLDIDAFVNYLKANNPYTATATTRVSQVP